MLLQLCFLAILLCYLFMIKLILVPHFDLIFEDHLFLSLRLNLSFFFSIQNFLSYYELLSKLFRLYQGYKLLYVQCHFCSLVNLIFLILFLSINFQLLLRVLQLASFVAADVEAI